MSSSLGRCLAIVQLALDPGILYKKAALFGGQEGEGTIAHIYIYITYGLGRNSNGLEAHFPD